MAYRADASRHRWLGPACLLLLTACGDGERPADTPRPVLVVQAGAATQAQVSAYPGEVRARNENPLAFRIGGSLVQRNVEVGDRVRRGDLLATLDAGDQRLQAGAAQAQLAAALARLAQADAELSRHRALAAQQLVSRSALDAQVAAQAAAAGEVRAARAQFEVARNQAGYAQLRAPRDGVIAGRLAEAGQTVSAGQPIYLLAGDAGREVAIAVPEARIDGVRLGQPAAVELWSAPGRRLAGRVREIAPAADPQSRTFATRIALDAAGADAVQLGQSARVYLQQDGAHGGPGVPLSAVQRDTGGNRPGVWVVDPATRRVRLVAVRLGAYAEDGIPVLEGLPAGAWVVAAGGHLLREGQAVVPVDRENRPLAAPAAASAR